MMHRIVIGVAASLLVSSQLFAGEQKTDTDGFTPMFNGRDLSGWVNVNCAPSTFYVKDGEIITTGKPTGYLRTAKQYENFIADFEWMHVPSSPGAVSNSGFFVWADPIPAVGTGYSRGIEVQVLVNLEYKDKKTGAVTATSHGDLFSIWGATCKPDRPHPLGWSRCLPSENRAKGANEWNHYRVNANNGVIKLEVNGKEVSGVSECKPRKGYLALESEGSECHFRNLKIKELPSTNPKPDEVADEDKGFRSLYTGLDLSGWSPNEEIKKQWKPIDWRLTFDGKDDATSRFLWSDKEYADFELITDVRVPAKKGTEPAAEKFGINLRSGGKSSWVELVVSPSGTLEVSIWHYGKSAKHEIVSTKNLQDLKPGQFNRWQVMAKGDGLTVHLNGKPVAENVTLPAVLARGRIGLQATGGPVEFANIFVRELKKE
jgi:3-keto-disaccharide hydrolase